MSAIYRKIKALIKLFVFLITFVCAFHFCGSCQNSTFEEVANESGYRIIDQKTLTHWHKVGDEHDVSLSPDGRYATWSSEDWGKGTYTFVISSTGNNWRKEFVDKKNRFENGFYSANSKYFAFPVAKGLCVVTLGSGEAQYMRDIFQWKQDGRGRWLAWQEKDRGQVTLKNLLTDKLVQLQASESFSFDGTGQWCVGRSTGNELYLYHLASHKMLKYDNVEGYKLKDDGRILLMVHQKSGLRHLSMVKLSINKRCSVYTATEHTGIVNYEMNSAGTSVMFVTSEIKDSIAYYSHWHYREGADNPVKLIDDHSPGIPNGLRVGNMSRFINGDKFVFFTLIKERDPRLPPPDAVMVDVWSHGDKRFYTAQPKENSTQRYPAVIGVEGGNVIQLICRDDEEIEGLLGNGSALEGDYALVTKRWSGDRRWEYKRDSIWLVQLKDGSRQLLPFVKSPWVCLSEGGKTVVGFDTYRGRHYYRYDITTGHEQKLSANVRDWSLGIENLFMMGWHETEKYVNHEIAARMKDNSILTYDNYDIWKIDVTGKTPAVNLTNGYGRVNRLVFRLTINKDKVVNDSDELLFTAFNEQTKNNGFFRKRLTRKGNLDSLFMGPYFFAHDRKIQANLMVNPFFRIGMLPVKADLADAWVVMRESATEAPNYFFTRDFKNFKPLTNMRPHTELNWYTTELVNYKLDSGLETQGILYKPKDFDPRKKYPILFYYYEQFSSALNYYILPAVTEAGNPNIPWFVSRGYLVFTPDNYFFRERRFRSVLQSVEGAAHHLSKYPFIDSTRMGIMGVSQGGGFTNYILTHSDMFAAAFEGCGVSDNVSAALQLAGVNGESGMRLQGAEALNGSDMWTRPEQWVGESSVLKAHKVTTPLLIMHNKEDGAVLFEQGIEMFAALWRQNKKVWLLQYDDGDHGVGWKDGVDLTTRMTQYFDHYLKKLPPPRWMTQGIPRHLKGIETRYELDPDGFCGKDCKICIEKKY